MKKPKKLRTKDAIIEAAVHLFSEQGVFETTMAAVATRAKVDPPLIHYYFPSKESLLVEVVGFALESLRTASLEVFQKNLEPRDLLAEYVRAPFRWMQREPGLFSIGVYFYYLASYAGRFRLINAEIRRTGRERISGLLYKGILEKQFSIGEAGNVEKVAAQIQGVITGNAMLAGTEPTEIDEMRENTVAAVLALCGALATPKHSARKSF